MVLVGLIGPAAIGAAGTPLLVFRGAALFILVMSIFTRAEWGAILVLPYKLHLVGDVIGGLGVLASPRIFGFADQPGPKALAIIAGLFGIGAGTLSMTDEMPARAPTVA